jgi:hypothetical protein
MSAAAVALRRRIDELHLSIKYEEVYLYAYETVSTAQQGLERYVTFYNQTRPHRALEGQTPDAVYFCQPARTAHGRVGRIS